MLLEQGQLPLARGLVMAQDIDAAIIGLDPKIPVIGGEPSIDNFQYLDASIAKVEGTRLFFTTIASVTLHSKLQERLLHRCDCIFDPEFTHRMQGVLRCVA